MKFEKLHAAPQIAFKRALVEAEHRAGMKIGELSAPDYFAVGLDLRFVGRLSELLDAQGQAKVKFEVMDEYVKYNV